jgi:hypothetical protein
MVFSEKRWLFLRATMCAALATSTASVGCAEAAFGTQAEVEPEALEALTVTGLVLVDSSRSAGEARHSEVSARFLQTHGRPGDSAIRMAGAAWETPATGACMQFGRGTPGRRSDTTAKVSLLNVGPIDIRGEAMQLRLLPRVLPDVANLMSGSVYGAAVDVTASAAYEFSVGKNSIKARAPDNLAPLRIEGVRVESGPIVIRADGSVSFAWSLANGDPEGLAPVILDILGSAGLTRCAFDDRGNAAVPEWALPARGTLSLHRLTRQTVHLDLADATELRFDLSESVAFTRATQSPR